MRRWMVLSLLFMIIIIVAGGCRGIIEIEYEYRLPTRRILDPDFTMTERRGRLILDASPTKIVGYRRPEFIWKIGEDYFTRGEKVEISAPLKEVRIELRVKAERDGPPGDGKVEYALRTKRYVPTTTPKVYFNYERIGYRRFSFEVFAPREAKYFYWKFGSDDWRYTSSREVSYRFSKEGFKTVKLEVYDSDWNRLGSTYSRRIEVY